MKKSDFYSFFRKIPKAELHLHIEAVISIETICRFYARRNPELDEASVKKEISRLFKYKDLNGFIQAYLKVQDLYDSVDDFDCIFEDLKNYIVRNGIAYAEVFAAPSAFIKKGFNFSDMVANYQKNIRKIKEEIGVDIRILIDVSRTFGAENSEKNLQLLLSNRIPEIIGIGLGGSEQKGPAKLFGNVFEKARKNGLFTVAHAGEDVGPESVWDSIQILHASRIGHGISSIQDSALVETLAKQKIPLEICPTSNVFTKRFVKRLSDHPARTLFLKGVAVTINTDDPLFFNVELLDEYWNAYSKMDFTKTELKQVILNSFNFSFLPDNEKARFCEAVENAWQEQQEQ